MKCGEDKSDRGSGRASLIAWPGLGRILEFTLIVCKYRTFVCLLEGRGVCAVTWKLKYLATKDYKLDAFYPE